MFEKAKNYVRKNAMKVAPMALAVGTQMSFRSYADGDLGGLLTDGMETMVNKGLNTFAAIILIIALITAGMSIYSMAMGQQSGDPSQKEKGQHGLVAALGCGVAAAFLLGCKTIIINIITAAMA